MDWKGPSPISVCLLWGHVSVNFDPFKAFSEHFTFRQICCSSVYCVRSRAVKCEKKSLYRRKASKNQWLTRFCLDSLFEVKIRHKTRQIQRLTRFSTHFIWQSSIWKWAVPMEKWANNSVFLHFLFAQIPLNIHNDRAPPQYFLGHFIPRLFTDVPEICTF